MVKWYDVYPELARLLADFYDINEEMSGTLLLTSIFSHKDIGMNDPWSKLRYKGMVHGVDPMHIFASFNRRKQSDESRINIINAFFEILGEKRKFKEIDFDGCPAPFSIKLMSVRDGLSCQQIWRMFVNVQAKGQRGIDEETFVRKNFWYGIETVSLTILLFWMQPKLFLPLDKNTVNLLSALGVIKKPPRTYDEYKQLLPKKKTNFYIDIAAFAYLYSTGKYDKQYYKRIRTDIQKAYKINTTDVSLTGVDFKLLGFKILEDCDQKYRKVLQAGISYNFYKEYQILQNGDIKFDLEKSLRLYDVEQFSINIAAVAGKNGSGKSTICELLFLAINNIAYRKLNREEDVDIQFEPGVHLEIYFKTHTLYRILLKGDELTMQQYSVTENLYTPSTEKNISEFDLSDFFYTIAVNYSHFGLNELELGDWVKKLFHKNDGYQTPIVINPYREEGNFNINNENKLVKSRLLANLVEPVNLNDPDNHRVVSENGRSVKSIVFSIEEPRNKNELSSRLSDTEINIYKAFLQYFSLREGNMPVEYNRRCARYILYKLTKICKTYKQYAGFLTFNGESKQLNMSGLNSLFGKIGSDDSHVVYKIKQVINYFRYETYKWYPIGQSVLLDDIAKRIDGLKSGSIRIEKLKTIELLPPSFYDFDFILDDDSSFTQLSSGEKQKIYTVSSIAYHLANINSVAEQNELISYSFANIMLDEIELYFHPDMQRTFIAYLISYLKRLPLDYVNGVNFLFITHSPFILSDIPSQNILCLTEKGQPDNSLSQVPTFGANIHDLLANNFFLRNEGYMGEFANRKIHELIAFLQNEEDHTGVSTISNTLFTKESSRNMIDAIGEPLIQSTVLELFYKKYKPSTNEEIDKAIERLQKMKTKYP